MPASRALNSRVVTWSGTSTRRRATAAEKVGVAWAARLSWVTNICVTIESGSAVTVHNNTVYPFISGIYSVNTDGEGQNGNNANFYQDFASVNGQQYQLDFDWLLWTLTQTAHLDVTITDTVTAAVLYSGNFAPSSGLHHVTALFTGTGNPLRLRIRENPQSGVNDNTFIVDNFVVDLAAPVQAVAPIATPTLDPTMLALMSLGLLAAGVIAVRRRNRTGR